MKLWPFSKKNSEFQPLPSELPPGVTLLSGFDSSPALPPAAAEAKPLDVGLNFGLAPANSPAESTSIGAVLDAGMAPSALGSEFLASPVAPVESTASSSDMGSAIPSTLGQEELQQLFAQMDASDVPTFPEAHGEKAAEEPVSAMETMEQSMPYASFYEDPGMSAQRMSMDGLSTGLDALGAHAPEESLDLAPDVLDASPAAWETATDFTSTATVGDASAANGSDQLSSWEHVTDEGAGFDFGLPPQPPGLSALSEHSVAASSDEAAWESEGHWEDTDSSSGFEEISISALDGGTFELSGSSGASLQDLLAQAQASQGDASGLDASMPLSVKTGDVMTGDPVLEDEWPATASSPLPMDGVWNESDEAAFSTLSKPRSDSAFSPTPELADSQGTQTSKTFSDGERAVWDADVPLNEGLTTVGACWPSNAGQGVVVENAATASQAPDATWYSAAVPETSHRVDPSSTDTSDSALTALNGKNDMSEPLDLMTEWAEPQACAPGWSDSSASGSQSPSFSYEPVAEGFEFVMPQLFLERVQSAEEKAEASSASSALRLGDGLPVSESVELFSADWCAAPSELLEAESLEASGHSAEAQESLMEPSELARQEEVGEMASLHAALLSDAEAAAVSEGEISKGETESWFESVLMETDLGSAETSPSPFAGWAHESEQTEWPAKWPNEENLTAAAAIEDSLAAQTETDWCEPDAALWPMVSLEGEAVSTPKAELPDPAPLQAALFDESNDESNAGAVRAPETAADSVLLPGTPVVQADEAILEDDAALSMVLDSQETEVHSFAPPTGSEEQPLEQPLAQSAMSCASPDVSASPLPEMEALNEATHPPVVSSVDPASLVYNARSYQAAYPQADLESLASQVAGFEQEAMLRENHFLNRSINQLVDQYFARRDAERL